MFVDASAIVAILAGEDDAAVLSQRFTEAARIITSATAVYEAVLGLARAREMPLSDAEDAVRGLLSHARAEIVPISDEIGYAAIKAFERYGRGRHPAQLNMGDCFTYACARALRVPLLHKGDDFSQTDIAAG